MSIDFTQMITAEEKAMKAATDLKTRYTSAIDNHVNSVAKSRDYNSAESLASYVASTNEVWKAEAAVFVAWRDAIWVYALTVMSEVQNGEPLPPIDEFINSAPVIDWNTPNAS